MMSFAVYDTEQEAEFMQRAIYLALGLDKPEYFTARWAEPRQRATDNKWVIPLPEALADVVNSELITPEWFPQQEGEE